MTWAKILKTDELINRLLAPNLVSVSPTLSHAQKIGVTAGYSRATEVAELNKNNKKDKRLKDKAHSSTVNDKRADPCAKCPFRNSELEVMEVRGEDRNSPKPLLSL